MPQCALQQIYDRGGNSYPPRMLRHPNNPTDPNRLFKANSDSVSFSILGPDSLDFGSSTPYALGLGALQMLGRNPALVIGLGTRGNSGSISTDNGKLVGGIDLL